MLLFETVSELRGSYPDITIEPHILDGIKQKDSQPFYLVVPIAKTGGFSKNRKRKYTAAEVQNIVTEVQQKRPEGRVGHPSLKDRAASLPDMTWLGAVMDGDTAWGKAYIYPQAVAVRDYLHTQVLANGRIGTSIFGEATPDEDGSWKSINVQAIDLSGHPDGISVEDLQAVPIVTSETTQEEVEDVAENTTEFIKELTTSRDGFRDKSVDLENKVGELTTSVNELTQERDQLKETLAGLNLGDKPAEAIAELRASAELAQAIAEAITQHAPVFEGMKTDKPAEFIAGLAVALAETRVKALDGEIAELIAETVKAEAVRPYVAERVALLREMGKITDKATAETEIKAYMETDAYKTLAKSLVSETVGGNTIVTGRGMARDEYERAGGISIEETLQQLGIGGGQ